jgi:hypothetical protein
MGQSFADVSPDFTGEKNSFLSFSHCVARTAHLSVLLANRFIDNNNDVIKQCYITCAFFWKVWEKYLNLTSEYKDMLS